MASGLGADRPHRQATAAAVRPMLEDALDQSRKMGLPELMPDILIALSCCKGRIEDAEEALRIAGRCGYRLKKADSHLAIAQLLASAADSARHADLCTHVRAAKEAARCDGDDGRYERASSMADAMNKRHGCAQRV